MGRKVQCRDTLINYELDMEVVGETENGQRAVALSCELMDVEIPVTEGAEATRQILSAMPSMKIWALSIYCESDFVSNMIRAGAMGYILKGRDPED